MALKAASLKTLGPGRYADNAHGLYFNVKDSGARSWVQRLVIDGRRRTFGLGPYPIVTLRDARDIAIDNVRLRRRGINPIAERTRSRTVPTFAAACDACLALHRPSWKPGSRTEANWRSSLAYAKALHDRPVDAVEPHDVIAVVSALYRDGKDATARSVRQRIRAVMEWARAEGHRRDNPADGRIDAALPKPEGVTRHHDALAWREVPSGDGRMGAARHRGDRLMSDTRKDTETQRLRITPKVVRAVNDLRAQIRKRPRSGACKTDRDVVVETLRKNFRLLRKVHRLDYSEAGPERYRLFAEWTALTPFPALAAARQETIEAAAHTEREAWHAALMIRIVAGPWPSPLDDDRVGRPLPVLYGEDQSADAADAARVASVAEALRMPHEPPAKRGRRKVPGDSRHLVAGAVSYCVSHGYKATRSSGRTVDCGCSLVAEALVPADVWERCNEKRRARAEESVRDAWHAHWREVERRGAERVRRQSPDEGDQSRRPIQTAGSARAAGIARLRAWRRASCAAARNQAPPARTASGRIRRRCRRKCRPGNRSSSREG